jgi:hypothetical protein
LTRSVDGHQKCQTNEENCVDSEPRLLRVEEFKEGLLNVEDAFLALEKLKGEERDLLIEVERAMTILNKKQLKLLRIIEDRSHLTMEMEEKISANADIAGTSAFKLFSIETWGSAWADGLIFTVMAENDIWAEESVRQWLKSNGRENHRIDKVRALVSKSVRGVVSVGAKLLDV